LSLFLSSLIFTFPLQPHKITSYFVSVFPHPQFVHLSASLSPYFSPSPFFISYFSTFFSPSRFSHSLDLSFLWLYHPPCIFPLSLFISVLTSFAFHIFCLLFSLSACFPLQRALVFAFVSLLPLRLAYFSLLSSSLIPISNRENNFFSMAPKNLIYGLVDHKNGEEGSSSGENSEMNKTWLLTHKRYLA